MIYKEVAVKAKVDNVSNYQQYGRTQNSVRLSTDSYVVPTGKYVRIIEVVPSSYIYFAYGYTSSVSKVKIGTKYSNQEFGGSSIALLKDSVYGEGDIIDVSLTRSSFRSQSPPPDVGDTTAAASIRLFEFDNIDAATDMSVVNNNITTIVNIITLLNDNNMFDNLNQDDLDSLNSFISELTN